MKKLFFTIVILISIGGTIYLYNYFTLTRISKSITNSDDRNEGIAYDVQYKNYLDANTLVFNLKSIPNDKAIIDIFRVLLQTASSLKEKEFKTIELSFEGKTKFTLEGEYFAELGKEFGEQNPTYTMRTFAEHLYDLDGNSAYQKWTGGLLGVLGKQMEDFKDFNEKWYLDDMKK